jgi:hypothetical protein
LLIGGKPEVPLANSQHWPHYRSLRTPWSAFPDLAALSPTISPWTTRGEQGAEALLAALNQAKPLFVAGHVRASGQTLLIRPTAVVFTGEGDSRWAVLPWLGTSAAMSTVASRPKHFGAHHGGPRNRYGPAAELATELSLTEFAAPAPASGQAGRVRSPKPEERRYHRMAAAMRDVQGGAGPTAALGMLKLLVLARDAA